MQDSGTTSSAENVHLSVPLPGERGSAVLAHMSSFLGYAIPLGQFLGPYTVELACAAESAFVRSHTREALNFQLTILAILFAGLLLWPLGIGPVVLALALLHSVIQTVRGARAASESRRFRYPLTIRLFE